MLAQEVDGTEKPVYYLSRSLQGAQLNYSSIERHCLAPIFTTQKLQYYFLAHSLHLVTKSNPLTYLLTRPILSGRVARWLLQLREVDITLVNPKRIKSQALTDLLAQFPAGQHETLCEDLPCEEVD